MTEYISITGRGLTSFASQTSFDMTAKKSMSLVTVTKQSIAAVIGSGAKQSKKLRNLMSILNNPCLVAGREQSSDQRLKSNN